MVQNCFNFKFSLIILIILKTSLEVSTDDSDNVHVTGFSKKLLENIKLWAPLIWLAPEEEFFPSSVESFLSVVQPWSQNNPGVIPETMPTGPLSRIYFLITKNPLVNMLLNKSSVIYGFQPDGKTIYAPVYVEIIGCEDSTDYQVTYWLFFPYNKGKSVCAFNLGKFGTWPTFSVGGRCLGSMPEFGNHVGDWEHMSIFFKNEEIPVLVYLSAHEAGAYYKYEPESKKFLFQRQELRSSSIKPGLGIFQRPDFPKTINLVSGTHLELFAARGSHGLWAEPGNHIFMKIPKLYDECGRGTSWETWKSTVVVSKTNPEWIKYWGRWGNPKSHCHPIAKNICHVSDGPQGIPMKKPHFTCR